MPEGSIIETFITLSAAVALLGIILLVVKKYGNKMNSGNSQIDLKVLAKLPLPPKNNIYLVKAGNKTLLIGANDKSITTLAELDENQLDDSNLLKNASLSKKFKTDNISNENIGNPLSFSAFLKNTISKKSN